MQLIVVLAFNGIFVNGEPLEVLGIIIDFSLDGIRIRSTVIVDVIEIFVDFS